MSAGPTRCALCDELISASNDTREHVIPNSIGGKRKVYGFICNKCNNTCGESWDAALAKQMNPLALFFDIERERGEPQPQVFGTAGGDLIMITPEGLRLPKPKVDIKKTETGAIIQVAARTMPEAKRILKGLKEKYPQIDVEATLAATQTDISYFDDYVKLDLSIGGSDAGRSIVKSAFSLAVANGVPPHACEEARRYLASGETACFGYYYERDIVEKRPNKRVFHCVAVRSTKNGLLLGYVELFSIYRIVICLSVSYNGRPISAAYAIDPMNGSELDIRVDLEFSLEDIEEIYAYKRIPEGAVQRAVASVIPIGIMHSIEKERTAAIERAVTYAFDNCGAEPGSMLTHEQLATIASMVTGHITPFLQHMAKRGMLVTPNALTPMPEDGGSDDP